MSHNQAFTEKIKGSSQEVMCCQEAEALKIEQRCRDSLCVGGSPSPASSPRAAPLPRPSNPGQNQVESGSHVSTRHSALDHR